MSSNTHDVSGKFRTSKDGKVTYCGQLPFDTASGDHLGKLVTTVTIT